MKINSCAFLSEEDLTGNLSCGTCNLNSNRPCEHVPISECPYKMFTLKLIDKEELNKRVKEMMNPDELLLDEILNDEKISGGLKNFIKANYLKCLNYAREFFADDLLQAAEYLYDMI